MGKLIVIEGTDGSGKSTQFKKLSQRLEAEGVAFQHLVFPRYDKESSALIRMYLSGEFGTKPTDVNAYAASAFYAVDRYASYKSDWGQWYEQGGLVLSDRYTTSNAVHQASKEPADKQADYLNLKKEQNPALGLRGVRLCLNRPELFRTQMWDTIQAQQADGTLEGFDFLPEEKFEDYELEFTHACRPDRVGFTPAVYLSGHDEPYPFEKKLDLRHDLFDEDAIILKNMDKEITLRSKTSHRGVCVSYPDMSYLGIWHWPKTDAPYVCIEPWTSLPSRQDVVEDFGCKSDMIQLAPRKTYENQWYITVF